MGSSSPRSYGGVSGAERQQQRRARLLEAALDIMGRDEWRDVTVERLCADAGLNKRYFYESFGEVDAVAEAVIDDVAAAVRDATVAAVAEVAAKPLEQQAFAGVQVLVHSLVDDPRRAKVLLGGVAATPGLRAHRVAVMRSLTGVLIEHARAVHGVELKHDPLALIAPAFVVGGTADAILAFVDGTAAITVDELIAQLTTLWLITGDGAAAVARTRLNGESGQLPPTSAGSGGGKGVEGVGDDAGGGDAPDEPMDSVP
ncbi:DNA-binding transcriptional regulator, AcrR family [Mycolicibacterium rutilum]|uniref:DNA-binding transcriptional regulator, AcrR family n=1 Tax=Mycolicibacterium rutilum TaxID=370526 RepID=A0A1H6K686_MYCRU|nr:TetR/AcrR family transcriptional regulator [Mycolicibacterium rutilum]SEH70723.1 DNA-binding transcriptional regulator, AcrR family [Mycolicibacterium rutilum]